MQTLTLELLRAVDDAVGSGSELLAMLRTAIQEAYPIADLVPIEVSVPGVKPEA
jgi:hypothetical protein